jgi:hypothetical protein
MASARPQVVITARVNQYSALASLAFQIVADMTTAIGNFPTPSPALAVITAAADVVVTNIGLWGPVGNRGSHQDLLNLRASCLTLRNLLVEEAAYVQNSVNLADSYPDQAAFIASSGFAVKNSPVPQGLLGAPQNLHQLFQNGVSISTPKLKWAKPLGLTSPNNCKSYNIYRSVAPAPGTYLATVTRTSFIDLTAPAGSNIIYYVKGVNTDGEGAESNILEIATPV